MERGAGLIYFSKFEVLKDISYSGVLLTVDDDLVGQGTCLWIFWYVNKYISQDNKDRLKAAFF